MAWKPTYATLTDLKSRLEVSISDDDTELQAALDAASRAVDYYCNRQFGSAVQTRYYSADCTYLDGLYAIRIDDVQTTTGLVVAYDSNDDATWSQATTLGTDWNLWPFNAASDGVPWTHLVQGRNYLYPFPWFPQAIKVTATFGWSSVPDVVEQATLLQATRLFVRRDSAYGVAGSPDLGNSTSLVANLDPDVKLMLSSVKRRWGAL